MPEVKGIKSRNSNKNYVNTHNARNSYATGVSGNLQTGKNHGCNNKKSREIIESASPTGLTGYNSADNPEIHQSHPQSPHGKPVLHVPPCPSPSLPATGDANTSHNIWYANFKFFHIFPTYSNVSNVLKGSFRPVWLGFT